MGEPARHTEGPRRAYPAPRRGRSLVRRLPGLAAGALALVGVVTATTPPAQAVPGFANVSPEYPVAVTITSVNQSAPGSNGTVQVTGTVTNTGQAALKSPTVGLAFGRGSQPLQTRSGIAQLLSRTDPVGADGTKLQANATKTLNDLPAGGSAAFDPITVPLADLKLDGNGVYELAVEVQAATQDDESVHPVGIARTLLPYFPDGNGVQPTKVATLWPLTHAPELVAQSGSGTEGDDAPVLRDDSLAADLAPTGRLGQLLTLGQDMPSVTWVVDPDLLDAVFAMTKAYRVQVPGHGGDPAKDSTTVAGTGQAVANDWLTKLRAAVTKNNAEVVSLPYADPDLASIAHNGSGTAGLDTARQAGRLTVEGRLSIDPKDGVAWPYQGYLDQATAQTAQQLGAGELLVNSASVPDQLPYTASAARQLSTGQTAVVADSTIAGLLQSDLTTSDAQTQATQRLLAETLAITLQQPGQQRTLLVMPPRTLTAATAKVLKGALATAQGGHWIEPHTLDEVAGAPADKGVGTTIANPGAYPADLRGSELPATAFQSVAAMQRDVDLMLRILTVPARVSSPFGAALARSVSTAWRGNPAGAATYRDNTGKYLAQLKGAVLIPPKSNSLTLAGDSGLIQVSVRNDLHQPVVNLELRLTSSQPNRLRVTSRHSIELPGGQSTSPRFQAQAVGNGSVQMTAQLWTVGPDAQPYGDPVGFTVEVSQVPSGVWWVVGAGALLVLVAGGRFMLARRKHRGEPVEDPDAPLVDPQDPDAPDAAAADRDAEPEQGSPAAPDGPEQGELHEAAHP
ncbi:DUF6049 family protein [Kitasatospora sp. NPDC058965]|uniref:DUF6049 family protein n=1 Tax=Kitasatospora sp. NPDC058965 TaxID=3346682 RepID=UPI00369589BB